MNNINTHLRVGLNTTTVGPCDPALKNQLNEQKEEIQKANEQLVKEKEGELIFRVYNHIFSPTLLAVFPS